MYPYISESEELACRVLRFLTHQGVPNLHRLQFEVDQGTLIVHGPQGNRSDEWKCENCCRHVAGVRNYLRNV